MIMWDFPSGEPDSARPWLPSYLAGVTGRLRCLGKGYEHPGPVPLPCLRRAGGRCPKSARRHGEGRRRRTLPAAKNQPHGTRRAWLV